MHICSNISEKWTFKVKLGADSVTDTTSSMAHLSHFLWALDMAEEGKEASRGYQSTDTTYEVSLLIP